MKTKIYFSIILLSLFLSVYEKANAQWTLQNTTGTNQFLMQIFFTSNDTGYIVTDHGELLKTINGGTNWNLIQNQSFNAGSVFFTAKDTGYVLTPNGYVKKTINGGMNWNSVYVDSNFTFFKIYFPTKTIGYIVGKDYVSGNAVCYRTINAGVTWTPQNLNIPLQFIPYCYFLSPDTGFILDAFQIDKTTDGGLTWTTIPVGSFMQYWGMSFTSMDTGYMAGDGGYIGKTVDCGLTWTQLTTPSFLPYYDITFVSKDTGFAVGGDGLFSGTIVQTNDGGNTWTLLPGISQTFNSVHFPSGSVGYACGTNGTVMKYQYFVSINEHIKLNNYAYYNKDDKAIHIYINSKTNTKIDLKLYDLQGHQLKYLFRNQYLSNNYFKWQIPDLTDGIYFVQIQTPDFIETKKLVVQK